MGMEGSGVDFSEAEPTARWRRHFQGVLWLEQRESRRGPWRKPGWRHGLLGLRRQPWVKGSGQS